MKQPIYENEINLRELFLILKKNMNFIIGFTFLLTTVSIIIVLLKQPIYEVKSNILVGFIEKHSKLLNSKKVNIDNPNVIVKKLRIIFNVDDKIKYKNKLTSRISDISVNNKLKNFIVIKTEAISNEEALKLNKKIVKSLVDMYSPKIEHYIINKKNHITIILDEIKRINDFDIKNIQKEIKILKTQKIAKLNEEIKFLKKVTLSSIENKIINYKLKISKYDKVLKKLDKNESKILDNPIQALYSIQILDSKNKLEDLKVKKRDINENKIVNLQRDINNIKSEEIRKLRYKIDVELMNKKIKLTNKINEIKYSISDQNIKNSQVVGDYIVKDNPIKPKKKLIVIISFITAFMLSIFIVFFREFISTLKYKEEEEK